MEVEFPLVGDHRLFENYLLGLYRRTIFHTYITQQGYICLQSPKVNHSRYPARKSEMITFEALYFIDNRLEWKDDVILFESFALSSERFKIRAEVRPIVENLNDYFIELLQSIEKDYDVSILERNKEPTLDKPHSRSRLTENDIEHRRQIVAKANKLRTQNPSLKWKIIAKELDVPERTLRDWRHNPRYQ